MIQVISDIFDPNHTLPQTPGTSDNLTVVVNIILGTMGALAFFMIILSGFRYVASQGEPEKIAGARRTIAYSIIGLVVIALAATIVNFVVDQTG